MSRYPGYQGEGGHIGWCNTCHGSCVKAIDDSDPCETCNGAGRYRFPPADVAFAELREKYGDQFAVTPSAPAHWMADCLPPDEWSDNPSPTPEVAAQRFLEIGGHDNDDCWEAWDEMERGGMTTIKVRRWDETTEIITDPDQQFDGYEPGQPWFKKTDEVVEVLVSLEFQILKRSTVPA